MSGGILMMTRSTIRGRTSRGSPAVKTTKAQPLPVAEINAAISALSSDDLVKVEKHIAFHKASSKRGKAAGTANTALSKDEINLLNEIVQFCRHNGNDMVSLEVLRASQDFVAFSQKVPAVTEWLDKAKIGKAQRRLMLNMALGLLYEEKTKMRLACSARVLMREVHRLPAVVDASFPGYAKAGLLQMIVRDAAHVGLLKEDAE